jgi:ElaB/YqjD/DUF883 family membrane-anchored ribosome-binding protein
MQDSIKVGKINSQGANGEKPSDALAKISLEFHNFIEDMQDLVTASTSLTGEDLTKVKMKMNELIASGKKSVEGVRVSIRNRAQKTATITNAYVHDKPWQAIGIGAASGLLLGYLLARRS